MMQGVGSVQFESLIVRETVTTHNEKRALLCSNVVKHI